MASETANGFKRVHKRWGRLPPTDPSVFFASAANIGLNRVAYEAIGKPEYIAIYWDEGGKRIAFGPGDEDDYTAQLNGHGAKLSYRRFRTERGISYRGSMPATIENGLVVCDVSSLVAAPKGEHGGC